MRTVVVVAGVVVVDVLMDVVAVVEIVVVLWCLCPWVLQLCMGFCCVQY